MIKGGKRSVLVARLSSSKDAITKFKSKCNGIWSIIKQVWYVPFIWSLAWFSYWIFQEAIVMGQPLTQGSTFNQIGLAVSIVAVLLAGYISGKSGEKNAEKTGNVGIGKKSRLARARRSNETHVTSFQAFDSTHSTHSKVNLSDQIKQQDIPTECLICPDLTSCDQRGKIASGSVPHCPYAKDNHGKQLS